MNFDPVFLHHNAPLIQSFEAYILIGLPSVSQQGFPGTLGCREIVPGVPPIFGIHRSLDLFCHLGVPPNIDIADQGYRVAKRSSNTGLDKLDLLCYCFQLLLLILKKKH